MGKFQYSFISFISIHPLPFNPFIFNVLILITSFFQGKNKPRGLHAARKLRNDRRVQRWADKAYKKRALGTAYKVQPFGGASHAKGIVLEKL